MPKFKNLGERCKFFEKNYGIGQYLMVGAPVLCRIDGRAFHSFCKGLQKPYDPRLSQLMIDTTKFLVGESNAVWGYTQSDEITLCWFAEDYDTQIFFDYRRQKMETQTAALATYFFNKNLPKFLEEKKDAVALFDSRVWSVPHKKEAVANLIWRVRDCVKNSLTMSASCYYSHKSLQGKNSSDKHQLLYEVGINWNDYPPYFKQGTVVRRIKRSIPFSPAELDKLPAQHAARKNPNLTIERTVIESMDMPPFDKVTNKIGVLFNSETPLTLVENNHAS